MSLQPGTRIGIYEITSLVGAGGMGEVYRARDTRLAREVGVKILPPQFASDPERLARFEREAHVLASLNHRHIAQIYGLEESGDVRALIMELVEGPTLADLIARGPLDSTEALRVAQQIAFALEAAHDRGITHRDLKPSNIKVSPDGSVKVLDFGLAKLSSTSESSLRRSAIDLSASPTLTSPVLATGVGVILGTAAYMSPEQARGKPVDKRADIWAFGCVLYEMLTGRRAFEGEDVSDTLAAVLRAEPEWSSVPDSLSPVVRQYLRRCLARDPSQRVRDIGDVRLALEGAFDVAVGPTPAPTPAPRWWKRTFALTGAMATVAIVAAALGAIATRMLFRSAPVSVARLLVTPPDGTAISPTQGDADIAVSPDGSQISFVNLERGAFRLYVRRLDQLNPVRLVSSGSPRYPFFSPDGAWIGFFDGNTLKKISVNGGPAISITSLKGIGRGATWGTDGTIVYATSDATGLMRVSAEGGESTVLSTPSQGEDHFLPTWLPGAKTLLFTIGSQARLTPSSTGQIAVLNLESRDTKILLSGATHAAYASSGHLVYASENTLRAVGFDLDTLTIDRNSVPVVERVLVKPTGFANFALPSNGVLAYETGDPASSAERSLVWVDRQGREETIAAPKRSYVYPRISPDGKRVALDIRDQQNDIWMYDFARQNLSRFRSIPA
jgi:hypothetical protein